MSDRVIKIVGSGTSRGGEVDRATIIGEGKITESIICNKLRLCGAGEVTGNVRAKIIKITGEGRIRGAVETDEIKVTGASYFEQGIKGKCIKMTGESAIEGKLIGDKIKVTGEIKVADEISGEYVCLNGQVKHESIISGETIIIKTHGRGFINEIGGTKVVVKRAFGLLRNLIHRNRGVIDIKIIEADYVNINSANVESICGRDIVIGSNCVVDKVEYNGTLKIDKKSEVKQQIKV